MSLKGTNLRAQPKPQRRQPWVGPRTQDPEYLDVGSGKAVRGARLRRRLRRGMVL